MTVESYAELNELDCVQNPGIGAYLIWNLATGFQEGGAEATPIPLGFLALPMLLHRPTFEKIAGTRKSSGLALFAAKFDNEREALIELHGRAIQLRPLSLQSLGIAATSRLISIDYEKATFRAYSLDLLETKKPKLPDRMKGFPNGAAKLGTWFSKLGIAQIASTLRVDF